MNFLYQIHFYMSFFLLHLFFIMSLFFGILLGTLIFYFKFISKIVMLPLLSSIG